MGVIGLAKLLLGFVLKFVHYEVKYTATHLTPANNELATNDRSVPLPKTSSVSIYLLLNSIRAASVPTTLRAITL